MKQQASRVPIQGASSHRFGETTMLLIFLAIMLLALSDGRAEPPPLRAIGEVKSTAFVEGKTYTFESRFEASVMGSNVYIKATILGDEEIDSFEYRSTGKDSSLTSNYNKEYSPSNVTSFVDGKLQLTPTKGKQRSVNNATVMLRTNLVPPDGYEFVTIVWLALGSKARFITSSHGILDPVVFVDPGFRESDSKLESYWSINPVLPNALEFLSEYHNGNNYSNKGIGNPKKLPAPFDSGFTNAVFQTTAWTNVGGLTLPLRFELV